MENLLFAALGLVAIYFYMNKFLFRGDLGRLFMTGLRGWVGRRNKSRQEQKHDGDCDGDTVEDWELIVEKSYKEGPSVPEDAGEDEGGSKTSDDDNFATADPPPKEGAGEEMSEWRADTFGRGVHRERNAGNLVPVTEARFVPYDDDSGDSELVHVADEGRIRREVARELAGIRDEELRAELEPTEEERYGIESFDMEAFR